MRKQREDYLEKCMQLLGQLKLTTEQLEDLEAYLTGEAGDAVLDTLPYQNLGVSPKSGPTELTKLVSRGYDSNEQAGRLLNILFAIGGTSCHSLLADTYDLDFFHRIINLPGIDRAKGIAIYAAKMASNSYLFRGDNLCKFLKHVDNDYEMIKRAFSFSSYPMQEKNVSFAMMHSFGPGRLFLLTLYFLAKYPKGEGPVSKEDIPMMHCYEDILLDNLENLFEVHSIPISAIQEIVQALRNSRVTERTLSLVGKRYKTSSYFINLFGGAALLNFRLSPILHDYVKICFAANLQMMFTDALLLTHSLWMDVRVLGGEYDKLFAIESKDLILQAASRELPAILKVQFHKNKDLFLQVLDRANAHDAFSMMDVLKQEDKMLFLKRQKHGIEKDREKLIDLIADKNPVIKEVKAYLRGEADIASLYPLEDQIFLKYGYSSALLQARTLLHSYADTYHDRDFYNRVLSYLLLRGCNSYFYTEMRSSQIQIGQLYAAFEAEHVDMEHQLKFYPLMMQYTYQEKDKKTLTDETVKVFSDYLTRYRTEVLSAFETADADSRSVAVKVLADHAEENKAEILAYSKDSSKLVRETLLHVLYEQKGWEPEVTEFLASKKAAERELAIRILAKWNLEKYKPLLSELLEKEKNAKVRALLQELLNKDPVSADSVLTLQDLVREIHKGGKKRVLAWAYETPFSEVHKKEADAPLAEEEYLQAILLCYASMNTCGVNKDARALAAELDEKEFAIYVNELFDKWLALGAEAKKRWVLYAASIHGGTDIIQKLQHQINEWPQHSRGAIAADAVQALALNPKPEALLLVDSISRKFKFRQVKNAAGEALKYAAEQLGITTEELADRIVPNLGFDEKMERQFDYGERKFTVTITPALEIEVFDESGKKLKNLPAPGKRDDPEKSAAAYTAFKDMKKQMKMTVNSQRTRLEMALSTERKWTCDAWKKLFVENPIMHQFAIGLIWGIYENGALTQTFRYMEDGSFNTEEEEEFTLPEDAADKANAERGEEQNSLSEKNVVKIGLVHPVEISGESIETWKTQLEDYEITQPIEQLSRPVYHMTKEEMGNKTMERFGGYILNDLSLQGKMQNMGWYRGQAEDAGIFYYYYREDKEQGLRAELYFSGSYVGGENEDVTVFEVKFNKNIGELPERYFSEIVLQTARATANSKETDPTWKDRK